MDKNAIKKYAVWARRELIERVSKKALKYGITTDGKADPNADSVNGRLLSNAEKKQRQALIRKVNEQGYEQVMEEVAYTWFNRFAALRFMEVNGYLPSHVRVFTNDEGEFKPQILSEAIHLDLDGINMDKVYELKSANKDEELFKYLLIVQCNALNKILPGMFQRIEDYTELLLPDYLLREGSVIERMVKQGESDSIPESDWTDQVQIIGWLYQFYNIEPKAVIFAKKERVTKEEIPAATQLFTPDWIVHYMVENSLGRLWLEGHSNDELKSEWKYYLDEAEQEETVQTQLAEIRKEYAALKPEEIRVIDPCSGSGHILCVLFDMLVRIYEDYGHTAREAATSIIKNNLWGLDIDERAAQLSYFTVMMKARQYDRRFLLKKDEYGNPDIPQPHVYVIEESNGIDPNCVEYFVDGRPELKIAMASLMKEMHDAKEYGSIISVTPVDFDALYTRFEELRNTAAPDIFTYRVIDTLLPMVQVAQALAQKYQVVVTNPPYMPLSNLNEHVNALVQTAFPDSKTDLYSVFIERCGMMVANHGMQAMITMHSWMTLGSFENLRKKLLFTNHINMAHLGSRAFEEIGGEVVQTCAWIQRNACVHDYTSVFVKLIDYMSQDEKEEGFFDSSNHYTAKRDKFDNIPGAPYSYWVCDNALNLYKNARYLSEELTFRRGITTADNPRFLRLWPEVDITRSNINGNRCGKWFVYNKGGSYRKWYGNRDYVINWENNGIELKGFKGSAVRNVPQQFLRCLSYSSVATGKPSFRIYEGFLNDQAGNFLTQNDDANVDIFYLLGLLNSNVGEYLIRVKNTTQNITADSLDAIPVVMGDESQIEEVISLVKHQISLAKTDWDNYEMSWDYACHPFIRIKRNDPESIHSLADAFNVWTKECDCRFEQFKKNDARINELFTHIYGLDSDLDITVEDKYVSVHRSDLRKDIKDFISYAVGCLFGRYSLNNDGLAFAGGGWNKDRYTAFSPDEDAIIPICDDDYFDDDILGRFISFIDIAFGKNTREDNLRFIADSLGGNGGSRKTIREYFINQFYQDHCAMYSGNIGKRPIYWLFDSGKKNGFKCLVYMHRYQPDTIARIRTDYVHEQQSRYRTAITDLEQRINGASTSERVKLNKQLSTLQAQATEIREYEEKIHHLADQMIRIDLDDGVKHNYEIFKDVLAKIK